LSHRYLYVLPVEALREALANAFVHRDYCIGGGSVGVAIYDDRLEISSTGQLHFGLTPEILFGPHESKPWNPMIASVFYRRGIIETWGRGIQKITRLLQEAGQELPELSSVAGSVLLTFPLPKLGQDGSIGLEPSITGLEPSITGLEPSITGLEPSITGLEELLVKLAQEYPKGLPGKVRKMEMESLIVKLCSDGFVRLQDLAKALNRSKAFLSEDYLRPMVSKASLMLRHPDKLKHPEQAYCSRRMDG
jgi:predicted HTH transcriptional regulator